MKLRLVDPGRITGYQKQITNIGNSVNDLNLYDRISKACLNKQAFLFVSLDGFVVLKPMSGKRLLIWVAFTFKAVSRIAYMREIERFGRDIEANSLMFWSCRPGFRKIIKPFGFESTESEWMGTPITVWSKQLTY